MNKQTKELRKLNISCRAARGAGNVIPTFHEFPTGMQMSHRRSPWKGVRNDSREIIYPAEFAKFRKK